MKSVAKLTWILLAAALVSLFQSTPAMAFEKGSKVEIEYGGAWYAGMVNDVKDGKFFVSYDGYEASWNEWVESARLRAPAAAETTAPAATEAPAAAEKPAEPVATTEPPAAATPPAATEEATAKVAEESGPQEITIRKGGSIWASVAPDGTIRVDGSIVGQAEANGNIRVSGMNSGEIDAGGTIRKGGSIVGSIDADGTLRANGSIVGAVESDGTIRKNGSIWGSAENAKADERSRNAVASVLIFFAGADFGF